MAGPPRQARRVEFGYLRTQLDLTSATSPNTWSVLETAGLVDIEKGSAGASASAPGSPSPPPGNTALAEEIGSPQDADRPRRDDATEDR